MDNVLRPANGPAAADCVSFDAFAEQQRVFVEAQRAFIRMQQEVMSEICRAQLALAGQSSEMLKTMMLAGADVAAHVVAELKKHATQAPPGANVEDLMRKVWDLLKEKGVVA